MLTNRQKKSIVEKYKKFDKIVDIAKDYPVSSERIRQIINAIIPKKEILKIRKNKKLNTLKKHFNI